jgi:CysZ protein
MNFFSGITYNLRGLRLGIKTPKLLMLGLIRFAAVVIITILAASLILVYHEEIMNLVWAEPASQWIRWVWYVLSWLLSLLLVGLSAILSYLVSQILFSVVIMDYMSRVTERIVVGEVHEPEKVAVLRQFVYLVKQEIPRTIVPVLLTLLIMVLGWLTPLGPVVAILSSVIVVIFLAWDNTDLVPARRLYPFKQRFKLLLKSLLFHLGFGLLFLIPVLNILFLSFAPVGATIYYIDKHEK